MTPTTNEFAELIDEGDEVNAGEMHFCIEDWQCPKHGAVNAVLHVCVCHGDEDRTYCLRCLCEALEGNGLKRLEPLRP